MLKTAIQKLLKREDLTAAEVTDAMSQVAKLENVPQIAAFFSLLKAKGETLEELLALYQIFKSLRLPVKTSRSVMDIVGMGGDGAQTINISTGSALLAASCGVPLLKHGNRAVSSLCGSADVLETLGVPIDLSAEKITESLGKHNFGFCYAPHFHPLLSALKNLRQELAIPTSLNCLGPLLNPAEAEYLMVGVTSDSAQEIVANLLSRLPIKRALVYHTQGVDEITPLGECSALEIRGATIRSLAIDPNDYGISPCTLEDLRGLGPVDNAKKIESVFKGEQSAIADTLVLNAGIATTLYGITETFVEGIHCVREKIKSGESYHHFNQLRSAR